MTPWKRIGYIALGFLLAILSAWALESLVRGRPMMLARPVHPCLFQGDGRCESPLPLEPVLPEGLPVWVFQDGPSISLRYYVRLYDLMDEFPPSLREPTPEELKFFPRGAVQP